jgi:hypothetical protein
MELKKVLQQIPDLRGRQGVIMNSACWRNCARAYAPVMSGSRAVGSICSCATLSAAMRDFIGDFCLN